MKLASGGISVSLPASGSEERTHPSHNLRTLAAGSGPPLVMLHGFGVTPRVYRRTLDTLAEEHRIVMPFLGSAGGNWTLQALLDSLLRTIENAGMEKPWLVGHSFGGAIALALAASSPTRFKALTVVDSLGCCPRRAQLAWQCLHPGNAQLLSYGVARDLTQYAVSHPRQLAAVAWWAYRCNVSDSVRKVREHNLPRSVLWARGDRLLPLSFGERLAASLDAPLTVVDAEGSRLPHDWPMRQPDLFARVLSKTVHSGTEIEPRDIPDKAIA